MTATVLNISPEDRIIILEEVLTGATAFTDAGKTRLRGQIAIQLMGPATAVAGVIERSTDRVQWAPIDTSGLSGNPTTGINVAYVIEPAAAYYRWRNTSMTGASVAVSISGKSA